LPGKEKERKKTREGKLKAIGFNFVEKRGERGRSEL